MEENLFPSGGMLASPNDIEEERRLFYVAITRAQKNVALSFSAERMRNGKHESNSPSRFLREISSEYYDSPELLEAGDDTGFGSSFKFGSSGSGTRTRYGFGSSYGASSDIRYERRPHPQPSKSPSTGRPSSYEPAKPAASSPVFAGKASALNRPLPPAIPDSEFVPDPPTAFKTGQRVEHNRFGEGRILEMSGSFPDVKAKIAFDKFGEKVIMLKYAKLRIIN